MDRYQNREDAGKVLAKHLKKYAENDDVLVLALPRGGVPVAYEVAHELKVKMDIFIVRKLGVPGHDELAMGAIAVGGVEVYNQDILTQLNITSNEIEAVKQQELDELHRRESLYRDKEPFPDVKGKIIILIDDGIATGATIRAAIASLRKMHPQKLVVAVPVADVDMAKDMQKQCDEFVCPLQATNFYAVGAWYQHFDQTSDEEVRRLLRNSRRY